MVRRSRELAPLSYAVLGNLHHPTSYLYMLYSVYRVLTRCERMVIESEGEAGERHSATLPLSLLQCVHEGTPDRVCLSVSVVICRLTFGRLVGFSLANQL